ncbi:MAG TPA: carboxylating nicotinate-nucleotide diphosphorylase [Flavitalea sp.]|nr:carboxylating nicotinate-nucleotide diphosphorylase [Flavitalea sp.]
MRSYDEQLEHLIKEALREDIGDGDHSTLASIDRTAKGKAVLKIKQEGVIGGIQVAEKIFSLQEPASVFHVRKKDGDHVQFGEIAFEVQASVHTILQCERVVLNCMQRMSGIATLTRKYVDHLKGFTTKLLDTRKTTPNFRLLEKEAVRIGGGFNHRMGLYDMVMLKDNHIDYAGGLEQAIEKTWLYVQKHHPGLKIEVETRNLDEVRRVLYSGKVNRVMLDNFSPADVAEAVWLVDRQIETEASGGINLGNIIEYAKTGVDFISAGALIHQAQSLDLSLKAIVTN